MASDRPPSRRHLAAESGNTLVLFPVAVLIVLGLGGLALDSALVFLGQRRLADLAAAVANDAAAALDVASFYGTGEPVVLAPQRVAERQTQLIAAQAEDRGFESIGCEVALEQEPPRAVVSCVAEVRPLFAPLLPGMERVERVRATETAVARQR